MQIKELSDRTGVSRKTIRYYEQIGLLSPAKRAENRYRVYDTTDVERLRFIKSARALDFTLQEIAQILATRDRSEPPCGHVMTLLQDHMDDIASRIRDLEQLHQELSALYETGKQLPEDVQMRSCVCHLIQVRVGRTEPHGSTTP
ncbi:MAG: heavy metal-responsive transcriptional regulator [Chloroflexi bacterium]|nr:heavy metal-responsive transcriptional regulator [Chloroflexota bacterium]MDL1884766.1 heavy metal-responsive transcriptional regulator [Anaerolineae bacterium CFX8]